MKGPRTFPSGRCTPHRPTTPTSTHCTFLADIFLAPPPLLNGPPYRLKVDEESPPYHEDLNVAFGWDLNVGGTSLKPGPQCWGPQCLGP